MAEIVRVFVVDDHPLIGSGLASILAARDSALTICGSATTPDEAEPLIAESHPDVVLCDVVYHGVASGLELLASVRRMARPPAVLMHSSFDAPSYVVQARALGATGYVLKTEPIEVLLEAIRAAASGRATYSAEAAAADSAAAQTPSEQELSLLGLVASGASNAEIARAVGIQERTVESRLHRLFVRYDVLSRTELAAFAARQGWLTGRSPGGLTSDRR